MTEAVPTETSVNMTQGFRFGEVPPERGVSVKELVAAPGLGVIAAFSGTFIGNGLNTIFRPQNFALSPTSLPNPAPEGPNDNVLEINLTTERLDFSDPIGSIPNRGFEQRDVFLNGVPYLQRIKDVSDPNDPIDIHFEPGIWLNMPPTTSPLEGPTLVRMASIPHGTTVEAQGFSFVVPGGPRIDPVDITPFKIGDPTTRIRFPSQTVSNDNTFRIPQDLKPFVSAGTITQQILDNPNLVIDKRQKAQNIISTAVILITTNPDPVFGGGTDNIAFLLGDRNATAPNADAAQMTAIFWIETVSEQVTLTSDYTPGEPMTVDGDGSAGDPTPSFAITSNSPIAKGTAINVTYPQIQYTQTVLLNFNGLSWPHISVATLVPEAAVPVSV